MPQPGHDPRRDEKVRAAQAKSLRGRSIFSKAEGQGLPSSIELCPIGDVVARDGRAFELAEEDLAAVFERTREEYPDGLAIDWDHSTHWYGGPAAGWGDTSSLRKEGGVVVMDVAWNEAGAESLRKMEYRFISPVVEFKQGKGAPRVVAFSSAALTNNPALKMSAVHSQEDHTMDRLKIITLLALSTSATDAEIYSALEATKKKADAGPTLDQYVPRADYDAAMARVTKLEADEAEREQQAHAAKVDAVIERAVSSGKCPPASADYYRKQAETPEKLEQLEAFFAQAPKVIGESPKTETPATSHGLTQDEYQRKLKIAKGYGISEDTFRRQLERNAESA